MIAMLRLTVCHSTHAAVLLFLLFSLSGCSFSRAPFANINADSIDESSPQTPARIRLSPPQVFTRGQLINDRLREASFLNDQLNRSATDALGSSLSRDLQTISALSSQLSLTFDPAAKLNFQRQNQLADMQQQIDLVQLQGQLATLKNQLQALQNGTGTGPAAPASSPSTTVSAATTTTASDTRITALQSRVDSAITALAGLGATVRQNAVTGTLEDDFEDRFALRSRIREAINANALDDAHDIDGNALYHLQFTAALLPGEHKGQFGVARINVEPPSLKQDEIKLLYYTWLATMTNRLNQNLDNQTDVQTAMSYEMLGPVTGLYDVAHMELPRGGNPKYKISIAVRPDDRSGFEYSQDIKDEINGFASHLRGLTKESRHQCLSKIHQHLSMLRGNSQPDETELGRTVFDFAADCLTAKQNEVLGCLPKLAKKPREACNPPKEQEVKLPDFCYQLPYDRKEGKDALTFCKTSLNDMFIEYRALLRVEPSVEAIVFALGDRSLIPKDIKRAAQIELGKYDEALPNARWVLQEIGKVCRATETKVANCDVYAPPTFPIPTQFCKALFANGSGCERLETSSSDGVKAAGLAYPYSAEPVLRSQRISTVASAANALDLAAAVTAGIPQSGAGVGADLGYSRRAAGRADTIERVPQVFGFAGPIHSQESPDQEYEFGWVFGPKMSLDAKGSRLLLRQEARTQQVSADVSVPSWWPKARLKVRTAWKGDFSGAGRVLDNNGAICGINNPNECYDEYYLPVRFNLNPAAMDALTVSLSRALTGQGFHQARIDKVLPSVVPVCADATNKSVTLLIYGIDLWRDPKVFFGGQSVPPNGITVLPDMTGIAATIDTSALSKATLDNEPTLVVWTAHGAAETSVRTKISATCEASAGETASKTPTKSATILAVSPSQISKCDASVSISIMGKNLSTRPEDYYLGTIRASGVTMADDDKKTCLADNSEAIEHDLNGIQTATVRFDNLLKNNNKALTSLVLTMLRPDGVLSTTIDVGGAGCTPGKALAAAFTLTSSIATLAPGADHTGKLRVQLTLPAGQPSAIEISAKGGEITGAVLANAKVPLTGGSVVITTSKAPPADAKPLAIDLTLRNLVEGENLVLSADAKQPKGKAPASTTIEPASVTIALNATAKPGNNVPPAASPQPFTFTSSISAITPANDHTATMRVLLSFPPGKKIPSIAITVKGGEISKAVPTDPATAADIQTTNDTVTVTAKAIPAKDAKPFGIDITFRNLVISRTLMLSATAKPATDTKVDPINIAIIDPESCKKVVAVTQ